MGILFMYSGLKRRMKRLSKVIMPDFGHVYFKRINVTDSKAEILKGFLNKPSYNHKFC